MESFAEGCVDHDPAPGQGQGRAGFEQFFTSLLTAFPDAHIEPNHLVADDDSRAPRRVSRGRWPAVPMSSPSCRLRRASSSALAHRAAPMRAQPTRRPTVSAAAAARAAAARRWFAAVQLEAQRAQRPASPPASGSTLSSAMLRGTWNASVTPVAPTR